MSARSDTLVMEPIIPIGQVNIRWSLHTAIRGAMPVELCFPFPLYQFQRSSGDYPDTYPM